jgi:hypothetical protein
VGFLFPLHQRAPLFSSSLWPHSNFGHQHICLALQQKGFCFLRSYGCFPQLSYYLIIFLIQGKQIEGKVCYCGISIVPLLSYSLHLWLVTSRAKLGLPRCGSLAYRAHLGSLNQRAAEGGSARLASCTLINNIALYNELIFYKCKI